MSRSRDLLVAVPLALASFMRLLPLLLNGVPPSTDSWPIIGNTEKLLMYTPINLESQVFDGYNNFWPANSLFGAMSALLLGVDVKTALAVMVPLACSTSVLALYAIVKRLHGPRAALIAAIILATAPTHSFFTAGITKETYATPLYLLLVLVAVSSSLDGASRTTLTLLLALALALSHHLTAVVAVTVLVAVAFMSLIHDLADGVKVGVAVTPGVATAAIAALYNLTYSSRGFGFQMSLSDVLEAICYLAVPLALAYIAVTCRRLRRMELVALCTLSLAAAASIAVAMTRLSLSPALPVYRLRHLIYAIPMLMLVPMVVAGGEEVKRRRESRGLSLVLVYWLAVAAGLQLYAVFSSSPLRGTLTYRAVNFLYPPVAGLAAIGVVKALKKAKWIALFAFVVALASCYTIYVASTAQEDYMGHHMVYSPMDYEGCRWISVYSGGEGCHLMGDMKVSYMMEGYFNCTVDVLSGYLKLSEGKPFRGLLALYSDVYTHGYVAGYYGLKVEDPKRTLDLDLIYTNSYFEVYWGEG